MTASAECYGEEQGRVINMRVQMQRVPFIILQKAQWEDNEDETHIIKMRHT